ncbi:MAG: hypothetical protein IJ540_07860 [Prevotella sp.]|nr:hypothetical protein [Prevotella sp.]
MKKYLISFFALATSLASFSQKTLEFHEAQTRVIEPMQDVLVRPLVADLEIIKQERQTYPKSWQFREKKLAEMTRADLTDAKALAAYYAAQSHDADVILGATFEIINHVETKGNKQIVSEYGVDVIVRGYPAKYTNWHKFGKDPDDLKWAPSLIDAQKARAWESQYQENEQQKTKAAK